MESPALVFHRGPLLLERSVRRDIRVARVFDPSDEAAHGISKLEALLDYLKAHGSEPAVPMRKRTHPASKLRWLTSVLRGHYNYYGVPDNIRALVCYRQHVRCAWHHWLQRRSQRASWTAEKRGHF